MQQLAGSGLRGVARQRSRQVAHLIMHKLNKAKQLAWLGLAWLYYCFSHKGIKQLPSSSSATLRNCCQLALALPSSFVPTPRALCGTSPEIRICPLAEGRSKEESKESWKKARKNERKPGNTGAGGGGGRAGNEPKRIQHDDFLGSLVSHETTK